MAPNEVIHGTIQSQQAVSFGKQCCQQWCLCTRWDDEWVKRVSDDLHSLCLRTARLYSWQVHNPSRDCSGEAGTYKAPGPNELPNWLLCDFVMPHIVIHDKPVCPVWARERCRISPLRFLAKCCKRQLNQGSFVLLYFRLFTFLILYWVCLSVFSCTVLFVSISQVIGCEDHLWNDLYCVSLGP